MAISDRVERTIKVLMKIYGPGVPKFPGSPHEGELLNDAEIVIHELAHQTLMPRTFSFVPGRMESSHGTIIQHIDRLKPHQRDIHEINAVAIELLVNARLRLGLDRRRIMRSALRNTETHHDQELSEFQKLIYAAQKTERVRFCADTIMCLIEETRRELRKKRVLH